MAGFECRNVCKHLNDFSISQISFKVSMGEITGVMGANGAGKSTLFNTITGRYRLNRRKGEWTGTGSGAGSGTESETGSGKRKVNGKSPDSGEIVLCGFDMDKDQKAYRSSMIFIDASMPFSALSNASEVGELYGPYYPNFDGATYQSYLKKFNINEKKRLAELSAGEAIRMQLAFAFTASVPLLLLDEPAANLDSEFREEFYDILREFVSDGKHAVLIASHILGELEGVADRILWLERKDRVGRMRFFGTTDDLKEKYRMVKEVPHGMEHLVIGGRKTKNAGEYLLDAESLNRDDLLWMSNDPRYDLRYPSLVEILYYCTKGEVAYD